MMNQTLPIFDEMNSTSINQTNLYNGSVWSNGTNLTTTLATPPDPMQSFYDNAAKVIITYIQPIITIVGLLGNAISFTVMQRRSMRESSVAIFMSSLSLADSAVLILDFLNNWVKTVPEVRIIHMTDWFCRAYRYIFDISYSWASWLVVLVAIERFIAVWFPFKAKFLCTKKNARIAVATSFIIMACVYTYNIITWQKVGEDCDINPLYSYFQGTVAPWMSAVLYSYIPIVTLIVTNTAIIVRLVMSRRNRLAMTQGSSDESVMNPETVRVTVTVVIICVMYVILTIPITTFYLVVFGAGVFNSMGPEYALIEAIILMVGLTNHAINFFLYTVSSTRYRKELRSLFCRKSSGGADNRMKKGKGGNKGGSSSTATKKTESTRVKTSDESKSIEEKSKDLENQI